MIGALFLGLAGTLIQSTPLESRLFKKPEITHGQFQGVLTERWHSRRLSLIGRFFKSYRKNPMESLLTPAIGAISYFSDMRIIDPDGLQDPVLAHRKLPNVGKGFAGHEKRDWVYALSKKPTYVMFFRELTPEKCGYCGYADFDKELAIIFIRDYEPVSCWLEDKENGQSGYFTFLQRKAPAPFE